MNTRTLLIPLLVSGSALAFAGCADRDPVSPARDSAPAALQSVQETLGETGPGSQYAFYVPDNWNGSLVLHVHGFRNTDVPVSLDNQNQDNIQTIRAGLTSQGFAVGYSSFSEQGWAVADGARRTHQLRGLFTSQYGKPSRTYLVGHSLGALIATKLVEQHPQHYDGVMPICGILGGGQVTINYIGNVRLLFDFFYPGALPGSVIDPAGATLNEVVTRAQAALASNINSAFTIAAVMNAIGTPLPVSGATPAEQVPTLVGSILNALGFHARGFDDLTGRTHGHAAFDNSDTDYVLPAVQNNIARYRASADARNYLRQWYEPTGNLQVPMLTLDPRFDPIAPLFHKDRYAAAVAANGAAALLVRETVPTFGHCNVPAATTLAAFASLVDRVEN
jgi:pimeloyl-ACP methyl ester carboxylesterase